jgi:hypothetical protein
MEVLNIDTRKKKKEVASFHRSAECVCVCLFNRPHTQLIATTECPQREAVAPFLGGFVLTAV